MKKIINLIALLFPLIVSAQSGGIITKIAGGGTSIAEWVLATDADITSMDNSLCVDAAGNIYFATTDNKIKKIDAVTGLIHTVAGTGPWGYTGDGGPATNAEIHVAQLSLDSLGNLYFGNGGAGGFGIRKIDMTTGIISTLLPFGIQGNILFDHAGNIFYGEITPQYQIVKYNLATGLSAIVAGSSTGVEIDGVPGTASAIGNFGGISFDHLGNLYIRYLDGSKIRKVDASTGIITSVVGNGSIGACSGDGGPATSAVISENQFVFDAVGNIIIFGNGSFWNCNKKMRKVDVNTGIITAVDSPGTNPPVSGAPITGTTLYPGGGVYDNAYNLYFVGGNEIWKLAPTSPAYTADSFTMYVVGDCANTRFSMGTAHYHAGMSVKTYFGDATSSTTTVAGSTASGGSALFSHAYATPGDYLVKHVVYIGSTAVDSMTYTYHFVFCNELSPRFYFDANSNCTFDSGIDHNNMQPLLAEVARNGSAIDTISATSGFNYKVYGNPGDVVSFRVIPSLFGPAVTCPASGIIYDTLQVASAVRPPAMFGMNCTLAPGVDLEIFASMRCLSNTAVANIIADNTHCNLQNGTVTMNISPKYNFVSAFPAPASVSGQTITWNLANMFAGEPSKHIQATFYRSALTPYLPGDTVNSNYTIDPITGDMVPASNSVIRVDTVRSGYDPNYITVSPDGYIPSTTLLTYNIGFENTGNDTAHNIYVLDTLSGYLNMNTFRILAASTAMNISTEPYGEKTIVKFDFPNIKLLDSSYHDQCHGMLMYSIKVKDNLLSGTVIPNRAGIYFDTNPVVMTNTVNNIIGWPVGITTVNKDNNIELYPNPATNELTIKTMQGDFSSLSITSSIGNVVMQHTVNSTSTKLDIQSLPPGIYYVSLKGNSGVKVGKFVKL